MKKIIFFNLIIVVLLISCGAPKQSINYREQAQNSLDQGNYQQSIENFNKYLDEQELKGEDPNPKVYSDMAEAYFKLKKISEAERYYDWAMTKNAVSESLNVEMSRYYKDIDNLSKEITALEYYRDQFPLGKDSTQMRNQMFEAYMESQNWEPALNTWSKLDEETKNTGKYIQYYFDLNKALGNTEECDKLAQKLLEFSEKNSQALEWMAKKYYNLGEDRYQSAMNAYNKKKTTKNYKILLKELDLATLDFKKSLKYFNQLWEMEDGKKYAIYLANIYARFDDKKKSQYFKSFIK